MSRIAKRPRPVSALSPRAFSGISFPDIPGPFTEDVVRLLKAETFTGASPSSAAKLSDYRRQLFMGTPITRTAGKKWRSPPRRQTSLFSRHNRKQRLATGRGSHGIYPQDVTPRRNQRANQQQQPARSQVERPDLEDVLTQVTHEIPTMRGEVANQPNQAPAVDVPEDSNFNWTQQKLPAETKFPVPCTGVVQRIAADLLARLPTMAARDQHDARFVLPSCRTGPILTTRCEILLFKD